jgi:hypothetical protein
MRPLAIHRAPVEVRQPLVAVGDVLPDLDVVGRQVVLFAVAYAHQHLDLVGRAVLLVEFAREVDHPGVVAPHRDAVLELLEHVLEVGLVGLVHALLGLVGDVLGFVVGAFH